MTATDASLAVEAYVRGLPLHREQRFARAYYAWLTAHGPKPDRVAVGERRANQIASAIDRLLVPAEQRAEEAAAHATAQREGWSWD